LLPRQPYLPLPPFAGLGREADQGGTRSVTGEGRAARTTLTRVASAPRLGPLHGPSPRKAGEV